MKYDFIAIDFETANNNNYSACSMGLAAVKDNEIVEEKHFLIQPPTLDFDNININIHGITPDDVKDAPKFPEVWDEVKEFFLDNIIVAHNAIFDMSVLKCCLMEYQLNIPDFNYLCSIPISTQACRGEKVGQSLKDRTNHFGIEMDNHHNALSDAVACAKLVIECVRLKNRKSFESFCKVNSSLPIKSLLDLKPLVFFKKRKPKYNRISISEIVATSEFIDCNHTFYNKNIVFTGELKSFDRREAMQKVANVGGIIKSGVSSKTDYLIVGIQDTAVVGEKGISAKEKKAYELKRKGHLIEILDENKFLKIL